MEHEKKSSKKIGWFVLGEILTTVLLIIFILYFSGVI
ncbi:MAG: hypothetical protein RLZ81_3413 [Pseudomonadota bacterium]